MEAAAVNEKTALAIKPVQISFTRGLPCFQRFNCITVLVL
jgi:hypothetical protein